MSLSTALFRMIWVFVLFALSLHADDANRSLPVSAPIQEQNQTKSVETLQPPKKNQNLQEIRARVKELNAKLDQVNDYLNKDVMYAKYNNHQTYLQVEKELLKTIHLLQKAKMRRVHEEIAKLELEKRALQNQVSLLEDFKEPPFISLTKPSDLPKAPEVTSPFQLFSAFAYIKQLKLAKEEYKKELDRLHTLIGKLEEKETLLLALHNIFGNNSYENIIKQIKLEKESIESAYNIASATNQLYNKKVDDSIRNMTDLIKEQIKKLINMGVIILLIFLLSFLFKFFAKKTITDNQRYYMAHKIINFTNLFLVSLVLLFYFLENATYLVTVLGFASAGIAIAMKDLFMSMLGWFVIVFGGSFHVGDRIKVYKGGKSYVGDIVDISFLRMTILEDITLTTYVENRRSGRVVFIPNNYVFTELLANYTHGKIKTVWDGIDITITFDSNHKKAAHIVKEIVKKYSKGYTDISRKQLNLLRNQYSLKNINVDPRIYTFIEKYGVVISCWYMTNSYAALTLRSNISALIVDEFNKEEDIKIAYDTHVVNIKRDYPLRELRQEEGADEESLS